MSILKNESDKSDWLMVTEQVWLNQEYSTDDGDEHALFEDESMKLLRFSVFKLIMKLFR